MILLLYLSWCSSLAQEVLAPHSLSELHSYSLPLAGFEMKVGGASMLTVRAASLTQLRITALTDITKDAE